MWITCPPLRHPIPLSCIKYSINKIIALYVLYPMHGHKNCNVIYIFYGHRRHQVLGLQKKADTIKNKESRTLKWYHFNWKDFCIIHAHAAILSLQSLTWETVIWTPKNTNLVGMYLNSQHSPIQKNLRSRSMFTKSLTCKLDVLKTFKLKSQSRKQ